MMRLRLLGEVTRSAACSGRSPARTKRRRPEGNDQIRLVFAIVSIIGLAFKAQAVVCSVSNREHHDRSQQIIEADSTTAAATTSETTNTNNQTSQPTTGAEHTQTQASPHSMGTTTDGESVKFPLYMRLIATFVCLIIFTVGVCGNLLVPLVVIKTKYLRNSTNLFLINLSIADLLVLIVCMPTVLIELHSRPETWLLGETMCKLSNFIEMLAANSSIFTILAISFERYYAICKPLKAGYKCTRLRATIIICIIWLLSCILTSPILIMAKSYETIYIDGSLVHNCILESDTYWHKMYVFISMFAFFCLPLLVLMLVYWLISRRLIRENVTMMDTTRDNLLDSRSSRGGQSSTNNSSISGIHVGSIIKKHFNTKSKRPLLSIFKSSQRENPYDQEDELAPGQRPFNQRNQKVNLKHDRIDSVLLAQANGPKRTALMSTTSVAKIQRTRLRGGKALSLDYQAHDRRHDEFNHILYGPNEDVIEDSLTRTRSDGKSCWSANAVANGHGINFQSSIVDPTTTETTTTTTTMSMTTNSEGEPGRSRESTSFMGRLFSATLSLASYLLTKANLSTKPAGSVCAEGRRGHIVNELDFVNGNDVRLKPDHNEHPDDADDDDDHDRTSAELNMSSTLCDNKLIDDSNDGRGQGEPNIGPKSFDIANMHSRLLSAIGKPSCRTTAKEISKFSGSGSHKGEVRRNILPLDHHQNAIGACDSANKPPTESSSHIEIGRACSSFSHSRRTAESNKKRAKNNRGGSNARSRFKWTKGVSVSSSTGSTRTNSTCLTYETSSASASLHNSNRQQNSPSPPRPILAQNTTSTLRHNEPDNELGPLVCNREISPGRIMSITDQRRIAHFENENRKESNHLSYPNESRTNQARVQTNSRSSSVTYHEAEDSCSSDGSSSPSLSITADSVTKPSWLESIVFQEQQSSCQNSHLNSQRYQTQSRRLSQHEEEQSDSVEASGTNDDLGVSKKFTKRLQPIINCVNKSDVSHTLEAVVKESDTNAFENLLDTRNRQDENVDCINSAQTNTNEKELIGQRKVKSRVTRSLTEERPLNKDIDERKLIAIDTMSKRPSHDSALPSNRGSDSGRQSIFNTNTKTLSKVNLISLAQSLHYKRTGQRSGSHPVVSNHTHLVGSEANGLHTEFIAVRDISKKQQMDSRRQVVAMLAFVVACFFLLFFPYRVFTIWLILSTEDQVQSLGMETYYNLTYFSRILIYLHSAINPIAYNLISTKFRRAFMSILLCRGASTRRNFTVDHRHLHEPKNQVNNLNRSGTTTNGTLRNIKVANSPI